MPKRIKFHAAISLDERRGIAAGLVPLADAGYDVLVEPPEVAPHLGWGVLVSQPGRLRTFRTTSATPAEWTDFVAMVLRTP